MSRDLILLLLSGAAGALVGAYVGMALLGLI